MRLQVAAVWLFVFAVAVLYFFTASKEPHQTPRAGLNQEIEALNKTPPACEMDCDLSTRDHITHPAPTRPTPSLFANSSPFANVKLTAEQVAEYNARHIEPFNPITGYNCRPVNEEGVVSSCESIHERPAHPYRTLPLEELEHLAYNDALAALYVAMRMELRPGAPHAEKTEFLAIRRDLILRAAAISNKSGPLIKHAQWHLNGGPSGTITPEGVKISYDLESVATKAAILTIASEMGDNGAYPQRAYDQLSELIETELPHENIDDWLSKIHEQTTNMRRTMNDVRSELGL